MARFTLLLLPLFLGLALSQDYADCGSRCPSHNVKCVGENEWCIGDVDTQTGSCSSANSVCPVCNDPSLTCHAGKCLKKTQGLAEPCCQGNNCVETVQHKFCVDGLFCEMNGDMTQGVCAAPLNYAAAGEACGSAANATCWDWGYLTCSAGVCQFTYEDNVQAGKCFGDDDCKWGFYCSGPAFPEPGNCTATYPNLETQEGRRLAEGQVCQEDLQCGRTMRCWQHNALEADSQYQAKVCERPFQRPEGAHCQTALQCKDGMYCSSNGRCTQPQFDCEGDRCGSGCGRGMSCQCPPMTIGGGFSRCVGDGTVQNAWSTKYWYDNGYAAYLECLDTNKCQVDDASTVCVKTHCAEQLKKLPDYQQRKCYETEPLWGRRYPGAGAIAQPASFLVGLFVSLAAYLYASS